MEDQAIVMGKLPSNSNRNPIPKNPNVLQQPQIAQLLQHGIGLHQQGHLGQAKFIYERILAVQPMHFDALHLLGLMALQTRNNVHAAELIGRAVQINPNVAAAHSNRGKALIGLRRLDEALSSFEKAIAIKPDFLEAIANQGNVLIKLKRLDEALASYDKAIAIKPDFAEVFYNRGNALQDLRRLDEALASFEKAIAIKPDYIEAINNRGLVLHELKRLDEAMTSYDKAIAIKPDYAAAFSNRGFALHELKRLDEALTNYDKALAIDPDYADAHWNKSLFYILQGEYQQGWALYEWRLQRDDARDEYYNFPDKIAWRGQSDLHGKTLLIHGEQGLGDVVQFCRYLPLLQSQGAKLIFEVPKALLSLISTLECEMTLAAEGSQLPDFDAYCPVMSLPLVFKTTLETIPNTFPYLFRDPQKVVNWQQRLGARSKPRIGLVWSGNEKHKNDANRSTDLKTMLGLTSLPVELHSLQKEYRPSDLEVLEQYSGIKQHQDELQNFSDTAALIECLDLVITVDTCVAHVAGALGKPVWILLPYMPDYRWLLDREDSPWYTSAKLYRQDQRRSWDPVMQRVMLDIQKMM